MIKNLIFPMYLLLLTAGCRKSSLPNSPDPSGTTPPELLVRETWSGPDTNGETDVFTYNSSNLVTQIQRVQWGSISTNGGPVGKWYDTSYTNFEYKDGLVSKSTNNEGGASGYFGYSYNASRQIVKRTYYNDEFVGGDSLHPIIAQNVPLGFFLYSYNTNGLLTEITDSVPGNANFKYDLSYNNDKDLVSVIVYSFGGTTTAFQKSKYEYPNFDDKINFLKAVNGLPPTLEAFSNYGGYSSSAPNNFIDESYFWGVGIDQPFGVPTSTSNSYEYDAFGFPTRITRAPWIITLEYRQL